MYRAVAAAIEVQPGSILFLSDSTDELAAAREAGFHVTLLARDGETPPAPFAVARRFDEILA